MNTAFGILGLDHVFVALPVPAGEAARVLRAAPALGLLGLSVTMPHKATAAAAVDELSPEAATLGAVNCVAIDRGRTIGHNTDGAGFLGGLEDVVGAGAVAGQRCVLLGAGGASRAIAVACAGAGAAEVCILNRTPARAEEVAELAGPVGRVGDPTDVADAAIIINATPVGMGPDGELPLDPSLLSSDQVVVDIVYEPIETPLLRAARAVGATVVDGVGMLVHQAGAAVTIWTDRAAPIAAMGEAARRALEAPSTATSLPEQP